MDVCEEPEIVHDIPVAVASAQLISVFKALNGCRCVRELGV